MSQPSAGHRVTARSRRPWVAWRRIVPLGIMVALAAGPIACAPGPTPSPIAAAPQAVPSLVVPTASPRPTPSPSPDPTATPSPTPHPTPAGPDPLLGTDGRLTVLLLGSDFRAGHPGNRMDAIMVVSIDPTTGRSAAFSVPRDITDFPLPKSGTFHAKVTGLYQHLANATGNGGGAMKQAVGRAFGIEVDRYVLIGFHGVLKLVAAVGGVDVTLAEPYYDPYYWVTSRHRGWGLPAGKSHLNAENALIFARSRKGDSDFSRVRRQQQLVMAAVTKVRSQGIGKLPELLRIARDTVRTDLPLARANDLFALFSAVDLGAANRTVFGPRKFAVRAGGTDYRLLLDVCRKWIAGNFPPARSNGTWSAP